MSSQRDFSTSRIAREVGAILGARSCRVTEFDLGGVEDLNDELAPSEAALGSVGIEDVLGMGFAALAELQREHLRVLTGDHLPALPRVDELFGYVDCIEPPSTEPGDERKDEETTFHYRPGELAQQALYLAQELPRMVDAELGEFLGFPRAEAAENSEHWAAALRGWADVLDPREGIVLLHEAMQAVVRQAVYRDDPPSAEGLLPRAGNLRPATVAEEAALQPLADACAEAHGKPVRHLILADPETLAELTDEAEGS